jgi:hypothetical protein
MLIITKAVGVTDIPLLTFLFIWKIRYTCTETVFLVDICPIWLIVFLTTYTKPVWIQNVGDQYLSTFSLILNYYNDEVAYCINGDSVNCHFCTGILPDFFRVVCNLSDISESVLYTEHEVDRSLKHWKLVVKYSLPYKEICCGCKASFLFQRRTPRSSPAVSFQAHVKGGNLKYTSILRLFQV